MQAQKFVGSAHEEAIRSAKSPMIAAQMRRDRSKPIRADWEQVKDDVMREAVLAKFSQHPDLREILLTTGDALIALALRSERFEINADPHRVFRAPTGMPNSTAIARRAA